MTLKLEISCFIFSLAKGFIHQKTLNFIQINSNESICIKNVYDN